MKAGVVRYKHITTTIVPRQGIFFAIPPLDYARSLKGVIQWLLLLYPASCFLITSNRPFLIHGGCNGHPTFRNNDGSCFSKINYFAFMCDTILLKRCDEFDTSWLRQLPKSYFGELYALPNNDNLDENHGNKGGEKENHFVDWRAFRARLVRQEHQKYHHPQTQQVLKSTSDEVNSLGKTKDVFSHSNQKNADGKRRNTKKERKQHKVPRNSWAYESSDLIEQGTVLLHHPPIDKTNSDVFGYGLGRQYLHKSVILILEHDRVIGTSKGVILNRPTDLVLSDSANSSNVSFSSSSQSCVGDTNVPQGGDGKEEQNANRFFGKIWYGGNERSIHDENPIFYCLHTLSKSVFHHNVSNDSNNRKAKIIQEESREVIHGIQFSTIQGAKSLVQQNVAVPQNFWVFCGVVSWNNHELEQDIHDGVFHGVSIDCNTLRKGLRILNAGFGADVRDGGVKTWMMIMSMIGRGDFAEVLEAEDNAGMVKSFDDLMLRVWATRNLVFRGAPSFLREMEVMGQESHRPEIVRAGDLVRAASLSCKGEPLFLLDYQEFHKSVILITQNDENFSVGVILNHPSAKAVTVEFEAADALPHIKRKTISLPLRYGGPLEIVRGERVAQEASLLFLHSNARLHRAGIGHEFENYVDASDVSGKNAIWKCTVDEVAHAFGLGLAQQNDFVVVKGFAMWPKHYAGREKVSELEIATDTLKLVPQKNISAIWELLCKQGLLSAATISSNLKYGRMAWDVAKDRRRKGRIKRTKFQDAPDVHDIVNLSDLNDLAQRIWVAAYLLDDPSLVP